MARLSQRHPEGPGDQPRKRKGHKRQRSSPAATTQRAESPSAELPEHQAKRPKRVIIDDQEQLARELEDSIQREQSPNDTITVQKPQTRQARRNSEPAAQVADHQDADDSLPTPPSTQPLSGLTPHLRRVGRPSKAARASRMSLPAHFDAVEGGEVDTETNEIQFRPLRATLDRRTQSRLRRGHLSEEINDIEEHKKKDSQRKKELAELHLQLHEKEELIADLVYQQEAQRLGNIELSDDQNADVLRQLEEARQEIQRLKASSAYSSPRGASMDFYEEFEDDDEGENFPTQDEDDANIVHEDDVAAETRQNSTYTSRVSTQMTFTSSQSLLNFDSLSSASQANPAAVPDKLSDQAVLRYETEIDTLKTEYAKLESSLRTVGLRLQNLSIVPAGSTHDEILTRLRHEFENVREEVEHLFPESTTDVSNGDLLPLLLNYLRGLVSEIQQKMVTIEKSRETTVKLESELADATDLVFRGKQHNTELETELKTAEDDNDQLRRQVLGLEGQEEDLLKTVQLRDDEISERDAKVAGLEDQLEDRDTELDRLRHALDGYRNDVDKLTEMVTRMDEQHNATIAQLTNDHGNMVQDLEEKLEDETNARTVAEDDATQKGEYIDELEGRLQSLETNADQLTTGLQNLRARLNEETTTREAVEADRDDLDAELVLRKATIQELEKSLEAHQVEIQELRGELANEQESHKQSQAAVEERDDQLDELNHKIHDGGIRENELRSKLFSLQQEKEQAIATLKEDAKTLSEDFLGRLNDEAAQRRTAEADATDLDAQVAELENELRTTKEDLADMTRDRDELEVDRDARIKTAADHIHALDQKVAEVESEYENLSRELNATIEDLSKEVGLYKDQIYELEQTAEQVAQQHVDDLATRDNDIQQLQDEKSALQDEVADLKKYNAGLEKRVEVEAMDYLRMSENHNDEAATLRNTIDIQASTIASVRNAHDELKEDHERMLIEKTEEIEELRLMNDAKVEDLTTLVAQLEELKAAFTAQEGASAAAMDEMNEGHRILLAQNEALAQEVKRRAAETVAAFAEMKTGGVSVKAKNLDLHRIANGKVTKVSENVRVGKRRSGRTKTHKRQWDSGVGMDEEVEEEEYVEEAIVA